VPRNSIKLLDRVGPGLRVYHAIILPDVKRFAGKHDS
jgi:hypothetical protein